MGARKPKNIYIIGAQSTGKTTLVLALEELWQRNEQEQGNKINDHRAPVSAGVQLQTTSSSSPNEASARFWSGGKEGENAVEQPTFIREVARTVLKDLDVTRDDVINNPSSALNLQKHILIAQQKAEKAVVISNAAAWFVSDRSAVDPVVHAKDFVGEEEADELLRSPEWLELGARMKEGCVFVCEAGTTWLEDDGVRAMPASVDDWNRIDQIYRGTLQAAGIGYTVIPRDAKDLSARVELILRVWEHD